MTTTLLPRPTPSTTEVPPDEEVVHIACERCYPMDADYWIAFCGLISDDYRIADPDTPLETCQPCLKVVWGKHHRCPQCGWDGR